MEVVTHEKISDFDFREAQKQIYDIVSLESKRESIPLKNGSQNLKGLIFAYIQINVNSFIKQFQISWYLNLIWLILIAEYLYKYFANNKTELIFYFHTILTNNLISEYNYYIYTYMLYIAYIHNIHFWS